MSTSVRAARGRARAWVCSAVLLLLVPVSAHAQVTVPSQFPTIQSAVNAVVSGAQPNGTVINVLAGTFGPVLVGGTNRSFTVQGAGAGMTIITGSGGMPLFINQTTGTIRFDGLTLTNGANPNSGGGFVINQSSNVTLAHCTVSSNQAGLAGGGGAVVASTNITIDTCTIQLNSATGPFPVGDGGGLYVAQGSQLTCTTCTLSANSAATGGGGLRVDQSSNVTMNGGMINGNQAGFFGGGGLFTGQSVGTFNGVTISGNTGGANAVAGTPGHEVGGGGMAFVDGSGTFISSTITGNSTKFAGGGLYAFGTFGGVQMGLIVQDSDVGSNTVNLPGQPSAVGGGIYIEDNVLGQVIRTRVHDNTANGGGGGMATFRGHFEVMSSFIESNHANDVGFADVSGQGGGILTGSNPVCNAAFPTPTLNLANSVVRNNTAKIGGGIKTSGQGTGACPLASAVRATLGLTNTLVDANQVTQDGAGIHTNRTNVTITNGQISRNVSTGGPFGGGITLFESFATITGATIARNTTPNFGGGIFAAQEGTLTVNGARIYANGASLGGGIFITPGVSVPPTGSVQNSVLADNAGFQIREDFASCAPQPGPFLVYVGNTITTGNSQLYSGCAGASITSIAAFNALANADLNNSNAPSFVTFAAYPGVGRSVLAWTVARATNVTVDNGVGPFAGAANDTHTVDVTPPCTTMYTLTSNVGGPVVAMVTPLAGGFVPMADFFAYDPGFAGGVYVAAGDVNGDGRADIVTGVGVGGGPHVKAFDVTTSPPTLLYEFFPYDSGFRGGVQVAVGDLDGDGFADIVTGVGVGGGPHVKVFDGKTGNLRFEFFPYDPGFRGGVQVAVGVNADKSSFIVTGVGVGGGPHVKVFDGRTGLQITEFFPYDPGFRGGVFVAAGDVNGDGVAEIITGVGVGGGPDVKVFDSRDGHLIYEFFAFDPSLRGGVQVAVGDVNGDGKADIITSAGPGSPPTVRVFNGPTGNFLMEFSAYAPGFLGGVFVGGGNITGDAKVEIVTGVGPGGGPNVRVFTQPSCP